MKKIGKFVLYATCIDLSLKLVDMVFEKAYEHKYMVKENKENSYNDCDTPKVNYIVLRDNTK